MTRRDSGSKPERGDITAMHRLGPDKRVILKPPLDDTFHAAVAPLTPVRRWHNLVVPVFALLIAALTGGWFLWSRPQPAPPAVVASPAALAPRLNAPAAPPSPVRRDLVVLTANEQQILDHDAATAPGGLTVFRFSANPRVLVLDFASLRDQARMLNRAAAFAEKTGMPHDRLMNDVELDAAIRAGGDTPETFYYGHDYGAAALTRFFALADRDNLRLLANEEVLRALLRREGWFEPNALAGLISIPRVGANENVDRVARATILRHELSHGEYFTNPAYAAYVHRFWTQTLTGAERTDIRRYLLTQGYESALDDLMENEAQAYLMFTDNKDFFTPAAIGMSRLRLDELRRGFFRAMPAGWLRDRLGDVLIGGRTAAGAGP